MAASYSIEPGGGRGDWKPTVPIYHQHYKRERKLIHLYTHTASLSNISEPVCLHHIYHTGQECMIVYVDNEVRVTPTEQLCVCESSIIQTEAIHLWDIDYIVNRNKNVTCQPGIY